MWHGSDMSGAGRLRAQWNEALLQLVVAPAYLELLAAAANALGPGPQFTRCVGTSLVLGGDTLAALAVATRTSGGQ